MPKKSKAANSTDREIPIFDNLAELLLKDLYSKGIPKYIGPNDPQVHIFIEAAHPNQLGRPSQMVFDEIMRCKTHTRETGVKIYFIEDRIKIPNDLNGHIICIGGPKSNVIARAALEYERDTSRPKNCYRRIQSAVLRHEIEYEDYHDDIDRQRFYMRHSIFDEIRDNFNNNGEYKENILESIREIYSKDNRKILENLRLYSPGKLFTFKDYQEGCYRQLRSVSARQKLVNSKGELRNELKEFVLFDHLVLTAMPNVFSYKNSTKTGQKGGGDEENDVEGMLFIFHGLRALATKATLRIIKDEHYKKIFKKIVRQYRQQDLKKYGYPLFQALWTIYQRPCLEGPPYVGMNYSIVPIGKRGQPFRKYGQLVQHTQGEHYTNRDLVIGLAKDLSKKRDLTRSMKSALVRLNQIDEDQILNAMALRRQEDNHRDDIFILGCFEREKTFYVQQSRAMTLIHALHKSGRLQKDKKILIVGAGASGIACAIASTRCGYRTDLIETMKEHEWKERFNNSEHRYIHPYVYDWPFMNQTVNKSDLEWLGWKAGGADEVWADIVDSLDKARKFKDKRFSDESMLQARYNYKVGRYFFSEATGRHCVSKVRLDEIHQLAKEILNREHKDKSSVWSKLRVDESIRYFARDTKVKTRVAEIHQAYNIQTNHMPTEHLEIGRRIRKLYDHLIKLDDFRALYKNLDDHEKSDNNKKNLEKNFIDLFRFPNIIDTDILIFATGFGEEKPDQYSYIKDSNNSSYWDNDSRQFQYIIKKSEKNFIKNEEEDRRTVIVSGSGDGALIDILRLVIKDFNHGQLIEKLCSLISENVNDEAVTADDFTEITEFAEETAKKRPLEAKTGKSVGARLLSNAKKFKDTLDSDEFKFMTSESERLEKLKTAMNDSKIEDIFEDLNLQFNNILVLNVDQAVQPFSTNSGLIHRLLVYALYRRNYVQFFRGSIRDGESDASDTKTIILSRRNGGEERVIRKPLGVIVRHGIGSQPKDFLHSIDGLIQEDEHRDHDQIYTEGKGLISLLNLTSAMHPETYKFYNYTIRAMK